MNRLMALLIVKPTGSKLCWRHSFRRKISAIHSHFMTVSSSPFLDKTPFDFCKWNKDGIIFPGIILCLVLMIAHFQNRREWKVAELSPLRQQLQICSSDLSHKIQLSVFWFLTTNFPFLYEALIPPQSLRVSSRYWLSQHFCLRWRRFSNFYTGSGY